MTHKSLVFFFFFHFYIAVGCALNLPRLSPWLLSAGFLWSLQADQNQESAPLPTNEYKITPIRICYHGTGDIDSGTAGSML